MFLPLEGSDRYTDISTRHQRVSTPRRRHPAPGPGAALPAPALFAMLGAVFLLVWLGAIEAAENAAPPPPAPESYEVTFETDVKASPRDIVVAVNRSLAPIGADNFYACVQDGFYNDSAFFRVVPGFVVQFGISGSKVENQVAAQVDPDDKVLASNTVGTLVYADAGPDTQHAALHQLRRQLEAGCDGLLTVRQGCAGHGCGDEDIQPDAW